MFVRICLLGALLMGALVGPAASQDGSAAKWAQVGGWQVRVDPTFGNGCFAVQSYEDGTAIRIGIDAERKSIYIVVGNDAWQSLEAGKVYPVRFVFDGQKTYDTELLGLAHRGKVILVHSNVSAEFTTDFMERTALRVYYRGAPIAGLSLRNTYAALTEVAKCQKEMWAAGNGNSGVRPASDPFSR